MRAPAGKARTRAEWAESSVGTSCSTAKASLAPKTAPQKMESLSTATTCARNRGRPPRPPQPPRPPPPPDAWSFGAAAAGGGGERGDDDRTLLAESVAATDGDGARRVSHDSCLSALVRSS